MNAHAPRQPNGTAITHAQDSVPPRARTVKLARPANCRLALKQAHRTAVRHPGWLTRPAAATAKARIPPSAYFFSSSVKNQFTFRKE
jgi:hypothetical protein